MYDIEDKSCLDQVTIHNAENITWKLLKDKLLVEYTTEDHTKAFLTSNMLQGKELFQAQYKDLNAYAIATITDQKVYIHIAHQEEGKLVVTSYDLDNEKKISQLTIDKKYLLTNTITGQFLVIQEKEGNIGSNSYLALYDLHTSGLVLEKKNIVSSLFDVEENGTTVLRITTTEGTLETYNLNQLAANL